MGDGRYYTASQFFNLIYLTTLIIYMVIYTMNHLYKSSNSEKGRKILTTYIILDLAILARFIGEIIVSQQTAVIMGYTSNLLFALANIFLAHLVLEYILDLKQPNKILTLFTMVLLWLLPVASQIILSIYSEFNIHIIQMMSYFTISIYLNMISKHFMPYRVSLTAFQDVKDLIFDYVFIIDCYGKIIYKNNNVINTDAFKEIKYIDIDNIDSLFAIEIKTKTAYNKSFIQVGQDRYFSYRKKDIKNKIEVVGSILTFIDITELIQILDELSEKQNEMKKLNKVLEGYSQVVYEIEKEKEISNLLDEIANTQEKSMLIIREDISRIIKTQYNDDFINEIDRIIANAKQDLYEVRRAVSTYRDYYGG